MSTERHTGESFEQYQARRKAENSTERTYLRGRVTHQSKGMLKLATLEMVKAANGGSMAGKFKLNDDAIVHRTFRKPPDTKLDKWQRRKLRKIVEKSVKKEV